MSISGISNAFLPQNQTVPWPNRPSADTAISANDAGIARRIGAETSAQVSTAADAIDIDSYFTPSADRRELSQLPPIFLPSQENIDTLTKHVSGKFQELLARNNIPAAPSEITYGSDGQIEFPDDYAYADQLKQALADDPTTERELRTLNALASHHAAMQPSLAFAQEYGAAESQQAANAILAKYSDLFSDNRHYARTALRFAADGSLSVTADGKPV